MALLPSSQEREAARCVGVLRDHLTLEKIIHTRTIVGRGENDYVRAYIIRSEPGTGYQVIFDITYFIAKAASMKMRHGGIVMGGGQYDKGLDVYCVARRAAGLNENQEFWREIR